MTRGGRAPGASPPGAPAVLDLGGDAQQLHDRLPDSERTELWWCRVATSAVVLGSRQPDRIDRVAAGRAGVEIARRRSGGGGVVLVPGEHLWVDLVVPTTSALWSPDVHAGATRLGQAWCEALVALGAPRDALCIHHGSMVGGEMARAVCFAGSATGEVLVGDAKLVGIAQRRSRGWARLSCVVHRRFRPELYASLLGIAGLPDVSLLGALVDADDGQVVAALAAALVTPLVTPR